MKTINDLKKANELIEDLKTAILSNIVITIRDANTGELLWSCRDDVFHGWMKNLKKDIFIEQDMNLFELLECMENL